MRDRLVFLDGLRGWAAVSVLFYHLFLDAFPANNFMAYRPFWQRVFFLNGEFAIFVFFIVSGFSLSIGSIRDPGWRLSVTLAFGRYFRLFIPIFAISAIVYLLMLTGEIMPASERPALQRWLAFEPTLSHLLTFSTYDVFFAHSLEHSFATPLWTMSIELIGSFIVFSVVLICRTPGTRVTTSLVLLAIFSVYPSYYALFMFGILLAEFCNAGIAVPRPATIALLVIGVALTTMPTPIWYRGLMVGACCIVTAVIYLLPVRRFFESGLSAYFGKISFPLYLVHAPVMYAVTLWLILWFLWLGWSNELSRIIASIITIPTAFAAAVVFSPINDLAIAAARHAGQFGARLVQRAIVRSPAPTP